MDIGSGFHRRVNRQFRLTRSGDIRRVYHEGKAYPQKLAVLLVAPAEEEGVRVCIVAGKGLGGAVQRNRVKRRMRSLMTELLPSIKPGWDLVLIARPGMKQASTEEMRAVLVGLAEKARLLKDDRVVEGERRILG